VVAAKLFAVQVDGGEGVEAVEDEAQPLVGLEWFVGTIEAYRANRVTTSSLALPAIGGE